MLGVQAVWGTSDIGLLRLISAESGSRSLRLPSAQMRKYVEVSTFDTHSTTQRLPIHKYDGMRS